jgi:ATP-binding cassette subfamily F protein uup
VVTSTLAMEGDGVVGEYVGGYSDWIRQRPQPAAASTPAAETRSVRQPGAKAPAPRKLSWKQQRELEELPARIEQLEAEVAALTDAMTDPAFYDRDGAAITAHTTELTRAQAALDTAYARWEELESLSHP